MADPVLLDYSDSENITLAQDLFGTAEQDGVEAFLNRYCQANRGACLEAVFRSEFSVGGVFGVSLSNGAREIIKVWPPHANRTWITAQVEIQSRLHGKGFPAPTVYAPPTEFEDRTVMAMEIMDGDLFTAMTPTCARLWPRCCTILFDWPMQSRLPTDWMAVGL